MEQEITTGRFTKDEIALVKVTFKNNLKLLKAIRKVFLQIELSEEEDIMIRTTIKGDVHTILSKLFLPQIDGDAPIKEVLDLMMTIDLINRIPEDAKWHMRARKKLIRYLEQILSLLEGKISEDKINFDTLSELTDNDIDDYINVITRNTILNHVETILEKINVTANAEEKTDEEVKEQNKLDSSK